MKRDLRFLPSFRRRSKERWFPRNALLRIGSAGRFHREIFITGRMIVARKALHSLCNDRNRMWRTNHMNNSNQPQRIPLSSHIYVLCPASSSSSPSPLSYHRSAYEPYRPGPTEITYSPLPSFQLPASAQVVVIDLLTESVYCGRVRDIARRWGELRGRGQSGLR